MKIRRSFLRLFAGPDGVRRSLPLLKAEANLPGPVVWLTAGAHGDEIGGVVVIQEIFRSLQGAPLECGTLLAMPLMNPIGFELCSRHVPVSEEDLNRSFPGEPDGSLAQRMAARIFDTLVKADPVAVLDLHNDWTRSIPYCVLDALPESPALQRAAELAEAIGFPVVAESDPLRHSLSHSLLQRGVAALTIELGESNVVNEGNVLLGVAGVWAALERVGLWSGARREAPPFPAEVPPGRLRYSDRPRCATSGILRFLVAPGQVVQDGQRLAVVDDVFGRRRETIRAQGAALVLGVADSSVAFPGALVASLGLI